MRLERRYSRGLTNVNNVEERNEVHVRQEHPRRGHRKVEGDPPLGSPLTCLTEIEAEQAGIDALECSADRGVIEIVLMEDDAQLRVRGCRCPARRRGPRSPRNRPGTP